MTLHEWREAWSKANMRWPDYGQSGAQVLWYRDPAIDGRAARHCLADRQVPSRPLTRDRTSRQCTPGSNVAFGGSGLLLLVLFSRRGSGFVMFPLRGLNLLPGGHMLALALLMMDALSGMGRCAAHSRRAMCHPRCATYRMSTTPRMPPPPRRASTDAVLKSVMAIKAAAPVETNADFRMGIRPLAGGSDLCGLPWLLRQTTPRRTQPADRLAIEVNPGSSET